MVVDPLREALQIFLDLDEVPREALQIFSNLDDVPREVLQIFSNLDDVPREALQIFLDLDDVPRKALQIFSNLDEVRTYLALQRIRGGGLRAPAHPARLRPRPLLYRDRHPSASAGSSEEDGRRISTATKSCAGVALDIASRYPSRA